MSIFGLRVGPGITIGPGITLSPQFPPTLGDTFNYTRNTFWNLGPNFQQSGITYTDTPSNFGGPFITWQLCYAWQSTSVTDQMGMNNWKMSMFATNRPLFIFAMAQQPNDLSTITPNQLMGYSNFQTNLGSGWYLTPEIALASPTIPANTYFMVGIGAFEGTTTYTRSTNSTALVSGQPFVTVTNMIFYSLTTGSPNGTPTQVGGTATDYVFREGLSLVATYRFS